MTITLQCASISSKILIRELASADGMVGLCGVEALDDHTRSAVLTQRVWKQPPAAVFEFTYNR
jgi:hypothetical protein